MSAQPVQLSDSLGDPIAAANAATDQCEATHPYLRGQEALGSSSRCELRAGHTGDHQFTTNAGTPKAHVQRWSDRATPDAVPAAAPPVRAD